MGPLRFIADYKENDVCRLSFNQLAQEIFKIDFEKWYQAGFWTNRYICYSYLDGHQVVSNVSVNQLELVVQGEHKRAIQIGTVMTHPDYRKQGLATHLLETVLDEYEKQCEVIYLFPEENALHFYRKFGFTLCQDGMFSFAVEKGISRQSSIRKLNLSQAADQKIFLRLASERVMLSRIFSVNQAQHILTWYAVGMLADHIYYLEEMDAVVICRKNQEVLQIYDVITRERLPFAEILPWVYTEEISRVVFHFTPDFPDTDLSNMSFEPNEAVFFKPRLELPERWAHPLTAHA